MISSPAWRPISILRGLTTDCLVPSPASNCSQETAGGDAEPSGESPMNSIAIAIVLAVY